MKRYPKWFQYLEEAFWDRVKRSPGPRCWEWTGTQRAGYGRFKATFGGILKNFTAHVVAYELTHGPVPDGMKVLYRCDNPGCCRPGHLFLGTQTDNMRDMQKKGRAKYPKGTRNGNAKYSDEQIQRARDLDEKGWGQRRIAKELGMSKGYVGKIINQQYRK